MDLRRFVSSLTVINYFEGACLLPPPFGKGGGNLLFGGEALKLVNLGNGQTIALNVGQAYSFFTRLKGLMFTEELLSGDGLHIKPCPSVHTFFMKYAIDILYLNKENVVVAIDEALAPGKVGKRYKGAHSVVELSAGTVRKSETEVGHQIKFI